MKQPKVKRPLDGAWILDRTGNSPDLSLIEYTETNFSSEWRAEQASQKAVKYTWCGSNVGQDPWR